MASTRAMPSNTAAQKRLRSNEAGVAIDATETQWINAYTGFHVPYANYTIECIPVGSITPEQFFSKYVCTRTPVVLTGYLQDETFTAPSKWSNSNDRLSELAGDTKLTVERRVGPSDNFGTGLTVEMPFCELLTLLASGDESHYLTTQEVALKEDGRPELMAPFMQKLQADFPLRPKLMGHLVPQNINMWMGNSKHGSSSGLHHDYHDNLYILMRGIKHFRLYSPKDAHNMYTQGRISHVHPNGLINYVGKETTPYGAELAAERQALAAIKKIDAERELVQAEQAMALGEQGAEARLVAAEEAFELSMLEVLQAGVSFNNDDEDFDDSTFESSESEGDGDERDIDALDKLLALDPHERIKTMAKRTGDQVETMFPENFSQVNKFRLRGSKEAQRNLDSVFPHFGHATSACCDLKVGDMLFLPASWFHEVESLNSAQGNGHLALNYWFHPPDQLTPEHFATPYSSPLWPQDWQQRSEPETQD